MKVSNENWRKLMADGDKQCSDLSAMSNVQLKDMLRRQETLIANRKFMNSLPDKGKKIVELKEKLQRAIADKTAVEQTSSFLAKLSLKETIDPKHPTLTAKKVEEDKERSTADIDIESKANDDGDGEQYDLYAVAIAETYKVDLAEKSEARFVPNKPIKKAEDNNEDMDSGEVVRLKKVNYYEDTALRPTPVTRTVKALSVNESLQLGNETKKKEQRLLQQRTKYYKIGFTTVQQTQEAFRTIRSNQKDENDDNSDTDSEANDINALD